jgi:hypothetical protein
MGELATKDNELEVSQTNPRSLNTHSGKKIGRLVQPVVIRARLIHNSLMY